MRCDKILELSCALTLMITYQNIDLCHGSRQAYFSMDSDDTEYYLSARKGGSPSTVIEDIKRGQEGVLVKLSQVTKELSDDELKLNNIFYKLGHHETELKSVNNFVSQLSLSTRRSEAKMNKQAFNVEFLTRQISNVQRNMNSKNVKQDKLEDALSIIHNLENKLTDAMGRLKFLENNRASEPGSREDRITKFALQPASLFIHRQNDAGACWNGWILVSGHCYYVSAVKQTFHQAVVSCYGMKGSVASLVETHQTGLINKLSPENTYWTSATDIFSSHQWTFLMSGRAVEHSMWAESERSKLAKNINTHCAVIGRNGLLTTKCNEYNLFICEQRE